MIRKLLVVAAAVAMPLGMVAVVGSTPAGAVPLVVANGTIDCTIITGSVNFTPKLVTPGTVGIETISYKMVLKGCTTTATNLLGGAANLHTITGHAYGVYVYNTGLALTANDCNSFPISKPLALTVKWTDHVGLVVPDHIGPSAVTFNGYDAVYNTDPAIPGPASFPGIDLPTDGVGAVAGVVGSFADGDFGATSDSNVFVQKNAAWFIAKCAPNIGVPNVALGHAGSLGDPSNFYLG